MTFFKERLPVIIDCLVLEKERTGIRVAPKIDFEGPAIPNFENSVIFLKKLYTIMHITKCSTGPGVVSTTLSVKSNLFA